MQLLNTSVGLQLLNLSSSCLQCSQCFDFFFFSTLVHCEITSGVTWRETARPLPPPAISQKSPTVFVFLLPGFYWQFVTVPTTDFAFFKKKKKHHINLIKHCSYCFLGHQNTCSRFPCKSYMSFLDCQPLMQSNHNLGNKAALKLNIAYWQQITLLLVKF